ncbi:protein kinase [Streptomyces coeruleoprunus]|uniref:non-specific serine/threonine protein kinase n=1 Tax=Streptomyces coeruleoprunus TaxID=285563 RepID=A0ABV9XBP7_9ACTN
MVDLRGSGAEALEEEDPRRIGPIPLIGRLGSGGMGRVFLGVHEGRYAAVKQVHPLLAEDEAFLRHFGHELDNLSRLPADVTAPLLASDRAARPPWLATAYVPGLTLHEAVELHRGGLPAGALWLLLREAATALTGVHARDMVHRDLKPSNVMLTLDGATLIDFGVARAADQSRLTKTGMVVGTPAYMAPEQATAGGRLSGATDVFALGSLIAFAACGRPPFGDGSGLELLYRIVHDAPDLTALRELDADLAEVVASCLDKDHEGRPTAAELAELAAGCGPARQPLWPDAVTERLSRRAAFAATVPPAELLDQPAGAAGDPTEAEEPATRPQTGAPAGPGLPGEPAAPGADRPGPQVPETPPRPPKEERRRRTRVVMAVVPVVVAVGGAAAVQLLPYSAPRSGAHAAPSTVASAPVQPTASASTPGTPGTAKPSTGPSASPGQTGGQGRAKPPAQGVTGASGDGGAGGTGGLGGSDGSGGSVATGGSVAGSGPGSGSGSASGSGSSSGSGSASGSGSGSGSASTSGGSSGGGATTAPPSSGSNRYRNGGNSACLTTVYSAASTGNCADSTASWTISPSSSGGFRLVNEQNGGCLSANMLGQATFVEICDNNAARLWRKSSDGTLRSVSNGGCLDLAYGGGVATLTCESGKASQRWARI